MKIRRTLAASLAALAMTGAAVAAGPAAVAAPGTTSLASVLASDGDTFDRNWHDFDILDQAVGAVLAAKPDSPVAVLADGTVPLTAFIPNDRAFQLLAHDLTHRWYSSEQKVLAAVASVGVDTVEQVLLYHVVPGVTIDSRTALASNGAKLTTAQGGTITVTVWSRFFKIVQLRDQDRNDIDPFLVGSKLDINKGNLQIAHGISRVLRPADL
jgi:uncharacterized surface protein with fasciclin (FAS1) repeats